MNRRMMLRMTLGTMIIPAIFTPGCSTIPEDSRLRTWLPNKKKKEAIPQVPTKMAVLWTPDILISAGKTPTRGFGGRIFFYNDKGKAVKVDGELVIHAFDDMESISPKNGRRYLFTPDQIPTHFSESDIGGSYSFWIPWDAMGGEQRKVTMISTFQPKTGSRPVQSEAATVLLPGTLNKDEQFVHRPPTTTTDSGVKQASYSSPASATKTKGLGLQTTTITR